MLLHEKGAKTARKKLFFVMLWGINAILTGLYGWEHLAPISKMLLMPLSLGGGATGIVSSLVGAGMAVVLCDYAYLRWWELSLSAETSEQRAVAYTAGVATLAVSLMYTAVSLIKISFSADFSLSLNSAVSTIGAVVFIALVILHIVWMVIYETNSSEQRLRAAEVGFSTKAQSEQLAAQTSVYRSALHVASRTIQEQSADLANSLAGQWGAGLESSIMRGAPTLFAPSSQASPIRPKAPLVISADPAPHPSKESAEMGDEPFLDPIPSSPSP